MSNTRLTWTEDGQTMGTYARGVWPSDVVTSTTACGPTAEADREEDV